jgi:hypothetical protein
MSLARLLPAALLLSSLTLFAQDQQGVSITGPSTSPKADFSAPAATPSEPWRNIPNQPRDADSRQDVLDRLLNGQIKLDGGGPPILEKSRHVANVEPFRGDGLCYTIRSYVVARDEKDSDSTHPVKSSTCQLASRYHVKNADAHPNSNDR